MSDMLGSFTGKCSLNWNRKYTKAGIFGDVPHPWFDFVNDPIDPLTYMLPDRWIRPAQQITTDFGSVPEEFQSVVGPLDCPTAYIFHDSAFSNHGWFESADKGKTWQYVSKTEDEVNDMLFDMAEVEGTPWLEREEMYSGVSVGGSSLWKGHVGPFPVDPAPQGISQ